jgi:hypothetical protein
MSLKVAVKTIHPDWSDAEIDAEVEELKVQAQAQPALPVAPQPGQRQQNNGKTFIGG